MPVHLPAPEWLHDAEQLVRYILDQEIHHEANKALQHVKYMRQQESKKYHKAHLYHAIRGKSNGLLCRVIQESSFPVDLIQPEEYGLLLVRLPPLSKFDLTKTAKLNEHTVQPIQLKADELELMIHDTSAHLEPPFMLTHSTELVDPQQIADGLSQHWSQYWLRDSLETLSDDAHWATFQPILQSCPPHEPLTIDSVSLPVWEEAFKHMDNDTARGACGWSTQELKMLPPKALQDLAWICDNLFSGFPVHHMAARTVPLGKKQDATQYKDTRPITVISVLYRLWSRVVTTQVLHAWGGSFDQAISGFLPGRDYAHQIYKLQHLLECGHLGLQEPEWGGLTLDLVKAFNLLGSCSILVFPRSMSTVGMLP